MKNKSRNADLQPERHCRRFESAAADLHDGLLASDEEAQLRAHAGLCGICGTLLEEAERGRGWARLLHDAPPEPPALLLDRILASTSMQPELPSRLTANGGALALPHPAYIRGQREARALMTATMALLSIALTWSVSGLRLHDFQPVHVEASATRQFFEAKKQAVSFYDNLRIVQEIRQEIEQDIEAQAGLLRKAAVPPMEPSARRENAPVPGSAGRATTPERLAL